MKRLMICLILLMLPCVALANGWGAPGGTSELFEHNRDYAGYTCLADNYDKAEATVQLIMTSDGHNQLICAEKIDGHWRITQTSTKAVWQPGDEHADQARLDRIENGFILHYPNEAFEFAPEDGQWVLEQAWIGNMYRFIRVPGGMLLSQHDDAESSDSDSSPFFEGADESIWQLGSPREADAVLTLEEFNIRLFPRSFVSVHDLNENRALAASGGGLLSVPVDTPEDKVLPVYSHPSENGWRAADGKAAVSLRDTEGLRTFGVLEDWELIEYKVNPRRSRIGYIQHEGPEINDSFRWIEASAPWGTPLTDDPDVSQTPVMTMPGDELTWTPVKLLDCYGPFYGYVQTELNGQPIRGFMPLQELVIDLPNDRAMSDQIVGAWRGPDNALIGSYIAFNWSPGREFSCFDEQPDGTLTYRCGGTYDIYDNNSENFNMGSPYALYLRFDDDRAACVGLSLNDDVMTIFSEASMDFARVEPAELPHEEAAMARMAGTYTLTSGGGKLMNDTFSLHPDGTYESHDNPAHTGTWYLTRYNPAAGYAWNAPEYTLHVTLDDGSEDSLGCEYWWYEDEYEDNEIFLALYLTDNLSGGGYHRTDVVAGLYTEVSGCYELVLGDASLMDYLFIEPDGTMLTGTADWMQNAGVWVPSAEDESRALTHITCFFSTDSPVHPGETIRFDCTFTPGTDAGTALLTFSSREGNATYSRYGAPGNG